MLASWRGAASMRAGIAITRLDLTASELRTAAKRAKNVSAARRMLCLAMVLEGADRTTAAEACGMDIVRPCGIGTIATMQRGCRVSTIATSRGLVQNSKPDQ